MDDDNSFLVMLGIIMIVGFLFLIGISMNNSSNEDVNERLSVMEERINALQSNVQVNQELIIFDISDCGIDRINNKYVCSRGIE